MARRPMHSAYLANEPSPMQGARRSGSTTRKRIEERPRFPSIPKDVAEALLYPEPKER
jgi:hypothetical protein